MQSDRLLVKPQVDNGKPMDSSEDARAFGQRVLRARLELGALSAPVRQVSQSEIGAAVGVTGVAVGSWEAGRKIPDLDTITRLAQVLRVSRAWLAFGDGPMREAPPAAEPVVRQERPSDSQEISHLGTPKRRQRRSNGDAG
jgi:transcriptional regulator with XRE-family HTH domain